MNQKDKENLSYLYDTEQYKSFIKLCNTKRTKIANEILKVDMSSHGAPERISMLQGQFNALEFLQLEIKKIHKDSMKES